MKKSNIPSSFYHYTSLYALCGIFDEDAIASGNLSFRFCNPMQSNDKREINFFRDYVFQGVSGESLQKLVDKEGEKIGKPFVMSLIHHNEGGNGDNYSRKGYPHCEIPMWSMYGDNFKGVRLKFKANKLLDYFESKSIVLNKCLYKTKIEMISLGRRIRDNCYDLGCVYKDSVLYKMASWTYENEWRAVTWERDSSKVKEDLATGKQYLDIPIPIGCLQLITVGPKADKDAENRLSMFRNKHSNMEHVKIEPSELEIN